MTALRESELSPPVSQWLQHQGYIVYVEVPHYESAKRSRQEVKESTQ